MDVTLPVKEPHLLGERHDDAVPERWVIEMVPAKVHAIETEGDVGTDIHLGEIAYVPTTGVRRVHETRFVAATTPRSKVTAV